MPLIIILYIFYSGAPSDNFKISQMKKFLNMKKTTFLSSLLLSFFVLNFVPLDNFGSVSFVKTNYTEPQVKEGDKGIGPFKSIKLGPIDQVKAKKGENLFMQKCMLCHELDNKKIGPPLRNVTKQETPEFILNMIVNPAEMEQKDEKIKELMTQYHDVPMVDQQISNQDALDILEYLRSVAK